MNRFFKSIVVFFILSLGIAKVNAQIWKYSLPNPTKEYLYKISTAKALTEEKAINKAMAKILYQSALSTGMNIQMDSIRKAMETGEGLRMNNISIGLPINLVCYQSVPAITSRGVEVTILCQVGRKAHSKPNFQSFDCSTGKEIKSEVINPY
ncbi:hypothetical protein [Marinifilum fragile]|uniref:hypothetical protein n=1 Tax=Marinifilum fragile TaxID=570161 RepID=UPI002AA66942|nr:hypothetical protein [Marinifilum fragile]